MEDLIKIQPDKERARSLMALAKLRHDKLKTYDEAKESSLIAEGFYEVIKELITAILFIDGFKTLSHKDLVEYIAVNFTDDFSITDINMIDELRKSRNKIVYYGVNIDPSYLKRNNSYITKIIVKLFELCEKKLKTFK